MTGFSRKSLSSVVSGTMPLTGHLGVHTFEYRTPQHGLRKPLTNGFLVIVSIPRVVHPWDDGVGVVWIETVVQYRPAPHSSSSIALWTHSGKGLLVVLHQRHQFCEVFTSGEKAWLLDWYSVMQCLPFWS